MDDLDGFARFAIYYAPPADSALWAFGCAWLGWNAETGEVPPPPAVEGLPAPRGTLVVSPRRYGFHGTLKPPFALAEGRSPADLLAAAQALAARLSPFDGPPLVLHAMGRFGALRPARASAPLAELAAACVMELDDFRAPPEEAELAKRRKGGLNPEQEAHLARWGYPYVLDQFHFHLTLTSALDASTLAAAAAALAPHAAPFSEAPMPVREICLFGDPGGGGPFRLLRRLPLAG